MHLHALYACPATVSSHILEVFDAGVTDVPASQSAGTGISKTCSERGGQKWPEMARISLKTYIPYEKILNVVTKCDKYLASNIFEAMFNMFQT